MHIQRHNFRTYLFWRNTGIEEITPDNVESAKQNIPIYLTDFKLFGNSVVPKDGGIISKDISLVKELELNYNENMVSLEFTGICYDCLSFSEYAYILDGFETTWNYTGKYNRATYSNLPAGSYSFIVKVKNKNGEWGPPSKLLDITINPGSMATPLRIVYIRSRTDTINYFIQQIIHSLKTRKRKTCNYRRADSSGV